MCVHVLWQNNTYINMKCKVEKLLAAVPFELVSLRLVPKDLKLFNIA